MKKSFPFILILVTGMLLWTACNRLGDIENAQVQNPNAEFAIPLINTDVSFADLVQNFNENTTITIEPDGLMRLNYKGDVLTVSSQDVFNALVTFVPPVQILDTVFTTDYDIPGSVDIDFIDFKTGSLALNFQNKHTQALEVDVYINEIEKDGQAFHQHFSVAASDGTEPVQIFAPFSLIGHRWNSLDDQFTVRYEAIKADGVRDTLDDFFVTLFNLEYSYAEGYMGNDLYEIGRDTIEIDFFDNWTRGDVYFEDPKIFLTAFNSFGFPADGQFKNILIQTVDGDLLPLESEFVTNGVYIDYPRLDEVGVIKETYFSFDKENSNIREVLGAGPVAIDYHIDGEPNPNMDTNIRGFLLDTSELRIQLEVELPIHGSASGFAVQDTFDADFTDYNNIEYAEFKLITENRMPLDVGVQLYFLDAQNKVLDSLLTPFQNVVESAPVGADGNVEGMTEKIIFIPYEANRVDKIWATEKVILRTEFSTYNEGSSSIRVLAEQDVSVRMGVKFGLE